MYQHRFQKGTDYKKDFCRAVDDLIKEKMPVAWKNKAVEDSTDVYISRTGEIPDSEQLYRLANYLLQEDLADRLPDKVTRTEYPVLSKKQYKLRLKREISCGELAYHTKGRKPCRRKKRSIDWESY